MDLDWLAIIRMGQCRRPYKLVFKCRKLSFYSSPHTKGLPFFVSLLRGLEVSANWSINRLEKEQSHRKL